MKRDLFHVVFVAPAQTEHVLQRASKLRQDAWLLKAATEVGAWQPEVVEKSLSRVRPCRLCSRMDERSDR